MQRANLRRDLVVGVIVGTLIGVAFTWWFARRGDNRPSFDQPSTVVTPTAPTGPGGGNVTGGTASPSAPRPPQGTAEQTLARLWEPVSQLQTAGESYGAVTLEALGRQRPDTGFIPGDRPSQSPREISVFVENPVRIYLSVLEAQQCVWMRDNGRGPEVTRARIENQPCSANSPPDGIWELLATS